MNDEMNATGLAPEGAPSIADLAAPEEGKGAWPRGWFRALVLAGYTTGRGKVMETTDTLSRSGDSRNMFLCLAVAGDVFVPSSPDPDKRHVTKGPGGVRNIRATFNYKPTDFTPDRIAQIKEARQEFSGVQGAWPNKDLQASSLSLARLGQLEKAFGFTLPLASGRLNPGVYVDQICDVRLSITNEGFSDIEAFAASGSRVK